MRVWKVLGQRAGQRLDEVPAPILPQIYLVNVDFQKIARLRTFDCNRTGQDMPGRHPLGMFMNFKQLRRNMKVASGQYIWSARDCVNGHPLAGFYGQVRL